MCKGAFRDTLKIILFWIIVAGFMNFFTRAVSASETHTLEIDLDRNLVYTSHYLKNSTGIAYKPIGWIMKYYAEPINADGQASIIVPCYGYEYVMEDAENPLYEYRTVIMDGTVILEKMKEASETWYTQINEYSMEVFVDTIMTITEDGIAKGSITSTGEISGEVYTTYEGVAFARSWTNRRKIKEYYDFEVEYCNRYQNRELEAEDSDITEKCLDSTQTSSYSIFAGTKDSLTFDISEGVPSGEELYLYGTTDVYQYKVGYQEINGIAKVPVDVRHWYRMSWYKPDGTIILRTVGVIKYYYVEKPYSYTKITSVEIYNLEGIKVSSGCFEELEISGLSEDIKYELTTYGESKERIEAELYDSLPDAPAIDVDTTGYRRPDLPINNYQDIAEENVKSIKLCSDKLVIDGITVLSDETGEGVGKNIESVPDYKIKEVSKESILIPKETLNGEDYAVTVQMDYQCADKVLIYTNDSISPITVHTPVVVSASITGDKSENENINPTIQDVVIGSQFYVSMQLTGQHRDILGYGNGNYTKYAGDKYVCFPFAVQYEDSVYEAGSFILLNSFVDTFYLPEYVKEGEYIVKCYVTAYNIPDDAVLEDYIQEQANLDISKYAAVIECTVNVIGKLYGFTLENNDSRQASGGQICFPETVSLSEEYLPMKILKIEDEDEKFHFSLYTNGIGDNINEAVDMDIDYFICNSEGVRSEVDVYYAKDELFTQDTLKKMPSYLEVKAEKARMVKSGVYEFGADLNMTDKLVIVPKDQDITDIDIFSEYIFWNQLLCVQIDIYATENGVRKLSYKNVENEADGYCNMWKKEEFNLTDSTFGSLEYGDVLFVGTQRLTYPVFEIIGTH